MKLWTVKAYGKYGAGVAVVAANDRKEAISEAAEVGPDQWDIDWSDGDATIFPEVECFFDRATLIDSFTYGE